MNTEILNFLKLEAIELSKKSCCNFQHAAFVLRKGRIITGACNDYNGHAECNAIRNLQRLLCGQKGKER